MIKALIQRYLLLSGLFFNLTLFGLFVYVIFKLVSLGVGVDMIATKVASRIEPYAPWVSDVIRIIGLPGKSRFIIEGVSLEKWQGKGANPNNLLTQNDSLEITTEQLGKRSNIFVSSAKDFMVALKAARPGDTIVLEAGTYKIKSHAIYLGNSGTETNRIHVQANKLGDVVLQLDTLDGFYINKSYWTFRNLRISGICANDSACEHAFHVMGGGHHVVIQNNIVTDFNAHVKVNPSGKNGPNKYPDNGVITGNSFYNHTIRDTSNSVTPIDMIGVNNWTISDNLIADFIKGRGNKTSYGAYFKGNASHNVFERNLVMCSFNLHQTDAIQIGLSFGGGGTGRQYCRNKNCATEHNEGTLRHNVIMNCNDVGIYLSKANNTEIYNNTLINTLGIDIRYPVSSAVIANNLLTGRIKNRDWAYSQTLSNLIPSIDDLDQLFLDAEHGDFTLKKGDDILNRGVDLTKREVDFCGLKRQTADVDIGAFEYNGKSTCNPFRMH